MSQWTIYADSASIELNRDGRGEVSFIVTNSGPVEDRAVFDVISGDAPQDWFSFDQQERVVVPGQSEIFPVQIVPSWIPGPGFALNASCQGSVSSASDPENRAVSQPVSITMSVPPITIPDNTVPSTTDNPSPETETTG
jgi:hypothetical protein